MFKIFKEHVSTDFVMHEQNKLQLRKQQKKNVPHNDAWIEQGSEF